MRLNAISPAILLILPAVRQSGLCVCPVPLIFRNCSLERPRFNQQPSLHQMAWRSRHRVGRVCTVNAW